MNIFTDGSLISAFLSKDATLVEQRFILIKYEDGLFK